MPEPTLNYLWAEEGRRNERYNERLKEAEARRLANLALGRPRKRRRRLRARLLVALRALLRGALGLLRGWQRAALGAKRTVNEPRARS